jgi:hypothetical protein
MRQAARILQVYKTPAIYSSGGCDGADTCDARNGVDTWEDVKGQLILPESLGQQSSSRKRRVERLREVPMTRGLIVVASLALSVVASLQSTPDEHTVERAFSEGGIVTLNLSSGDYTVRAGASARVRVQWRAEDPTDEMDLRKIQVVFDVFERVATIRTKGPTNRASASRSKCRHDRMCTCASVLGHPH